MVTFEKDLASLITELANRCEESIAEFKRRKEHEASKMRENYKILLRLQELAPWIEYKVERMSDLLYANVGIFVQREDLPRLRECLGRLTIQWRDLHDAHSVPPMARVAIRSKKIPELTIFYLAEITEDSPCRIVEQSETTKKMVCDRNRHVADEEAS